MMYGLVGLIIVVLGAVVGWNLGYSYLPFDCGETRGDVGIVLGGISGLVLAIFLGINLSNYIEENVVVTETTTEVNVIGAEIQQVKTGKASSAPYIVFTDDTGKTVQIPASTTQIIDSDDWKFIRIDYEVKGWMSFFKDDFGEYFIYVPIEVLYPNIAQK